MDFTTRSTVSPVASPGELVRTLAEVMSEIEGLRRELDAAADLRDDILKLLGPLMSDPAMLGIRRMRIYHGGAWRVLTIRADPLEPAEDIYAEMAKLEDPESLRWPEPETLPIDPRD